MVSIFLDERQDDFWMFFCIMVSILLDCAVKIVSLFFVLWQEDFSMFLKMMLYLGVNIFGLCRNMKIALFHGIDVFWIAQSKCFQHVWMCNKIIFSMFLNITLYLGVDIFGLLQFQIAQ